MSMQFKKFLIIIISHDALSIFAEIWVQTLSDLYMSTCLPI